MVREMMPMQSPTHPPMQPWPRPPRRAPHGFTLIEVMVVVAIIAILAMMAVPNLQDRRVREQIAEAMPLADIAKPPVALAWAAKLPLPADNTAAGLPAADKIVSDLVQSVELRNGAIHITFGNRANGALKGKVLSLRPAVVEGEPIVPITWVCGNASAPNKMTLKGDDRTTIAPQFIPLRCRAPG
jgi:type IV pilus assembly protein PilA